MDFLFDIGNVVIHVDFIPALKRLIPPDINAPDDIDARLHKLLERKDEFEAGRIDSDIYFPWAADVLGFTGNQEEFLRAWVDIFEPNLPMWETIEKLSSEGHRLILFSNINNPHKEYLIEKYSIFQHFTGSIFSYQTGHIKPEEAIYQLAIKQYSLTPDSTAYIDDLHANIEAGKKAGFICHTYRGDQHAQFLQWLSSL